MKQMIVSNKNSIITSLIFMIVALLVYTGYYIYKRQEDLEYRWHEVKQEYIPMREAISAKPQVIERVVSTTSLWRPVQERVRDTVVQIVCHAVDFDLLQPFRTPEQGTKVGTGFFINDQGDVITNAHVIDQAKAIWLQIPSLGKRIIDAEVISISPDRDLALLRIDKENVEFIRRELGGIPFLPLGDSDLVRRSDEVLAVGYPLGQQSLKSTTGVVSGREQYLIQTSAPINPGNSGGPLLNAQGEVVGINNANVPAAQNVGYAIPVNDLKIVLPDMYKTKILRKPFLGILFNNGSDDLTEYLGNPAPGGCYVVDVVKGSVLEKAGVKRGDMIYELNGHKVDMFGEMTVPWSEDKLAMVDFVNRLSVGEDMRVVVYRYSERKEFSFKLDLIEQPAIRRVFPGFEPIDYEVFAGMVIMPLTKNHFQLLGQQAPGLVRFSEMKNQNSPVLVVTHIFPNSHVYRMRNIAVGSTINEVNGKPIATLDDLRAVLKKSVGQKMITIRVSDNVTRVSDNIFVALPWDKVIDQEMRLAKDYNYHPSDTIQDIIKIANAHNAINTITA